MCWRPAAPGHFAVDAERADEPVPETLGRRFDGTPEQFRLAWTRAEVLAKLHDTPIVMWLREHPLQWPVGENEPDAAVLHQRIDDLVVCFGRRSV